MLGEVVVPADAVEVVVDWRRFVIESVFAEDFETRALLVLQSQSQSRG